MVSQIILSQWTASVIGTLILLLLSTVSFFLIRYFKSQDKVIERLTESIDKLSGLISAMNATVIANTMDIDFIKKDREKQSNICTKNFDKLEKIIDKI